jgi:hypothetical protein
MAKRGELTDAIKAKAKELLGYEITQRELRTMPYIQYCVLNGQNIDPRKINAEERTILSDWRQKGFIEGGASDLAISKDFWDALHEILWISYVDIADDLVPDAAPANAQAQ